MKKQTTNGIYHFSSRLMGSAAIMGVFLISCSTKNINKQEETQQVQAEKTSSAVSDLPKSFNNTIDQTGNPNHQLKTSSEQSYKKATTQPLTDFANYSSEVRNTQTMAEKARQLEKKLDASLSEFDEMLLIKNEALSILGKKDQTSGGDEANNRDGTESSSKDQSGGSVAASRGSAQVITGSAPPQGQAYENDDIVARQIKEAAEQENDPELKKKLWEEYQKYKSGR